MLGMLNKSKLANQMAPIRQMVNTVKSAGNPQMMLQQMMMQNPQVQVLIQQNGGDAQKAFYSLANQMGIDPDEILSIFK